MICCDRNFLTYLGHESDRQTSTTGYPVSFGLIHSLFSFLKIREGFLKPRSTYRLTLIGNISIQTNMKISFAALCLATPATTYAFTPARASGRNSALLSTVEAPQREAPGAGYVPEWENRPGLSEEEFMKSDMTKPDLSEMWECPLTRWDSDT